MSILQYKKKIIFTDLDESLLKNNKFNSRVLVSFIKNLLIDNFSIVAITSKTYLEVFDLFKENSLNFPFSTENGAAFYMPINKNSYYKKTNSNAKESTIIKEILLTKIKKNYLKFIKLIEYLDADTQMSITKLSKADIDKFIKRKYSVPILWEGNNNLFEIFKNDLKRYNLKIAFGGKLWNISGNHNKLDAFNFYLNELFPKYIEDEILTIAIGDSMNDIEMLNKAKYSGIVKNESHIKIKLNKKKNIFYSNYSAPEGWVEIIKDIKNYMEKDYY